MLVGLELLKASDAFTDGSLFYWHREAANSTAEVDYLVQHNGAVLPVEVKAAARDTLDRVRAFIKARPTVYLSTHCPEGYESLELKRVMKLA